MKAKLILLIRLIALTVLYFVCFAAVSGALLPPLDKQPTAAQASATVVTLLVVSFLNTAVLAYFILRSCWAGWKLVLTIFFIFYGVVTVMPQIETAFFVTRLPPGMLWRIFLMGAVVAALWSPLAVLILGKRRLHRLNDGGNSRLTIGKWIWRISSCVVVRGVDEFSTVNTQPAYATGSADVHLLETVSSNFLFGWLIVWLLRGGALMKAS